MLPTFGAVEWDEVGDLLTVKWTLELWEWEVIHRGIVRYRNLYIEAKPSCIRFINNKAKPSCLCEGISRSRVV